MKRFILPLVVIAIFFSACEDGEENNNMEADANQENQQENENNDNNGNQNSNDQNESKNDNQNEADDERSEELNSFIQHFKENGIDIDNETSVLYETIGAIDGVRLHINEDVAELYLYEEGTEDFEEMKESENAQVNGNIVLAFHTNHPEVDKIEEVFNNY